MSNWLKPLNLRRKLRICSSHHKDDSIDDWVAFMIWVGWWMRRTIVRNVKVFCILLLPTRISCSAFCALGALIGSIGKLKDGLTWDEFIALPNGAKIYQYIIDQEPSQDMLLREFNIVVGKLVKSGDQIFRRITRDSGKSRLDKLVFIENFYRYSFFLEKLKKKQRKSRQKITKFLGDLRSLNVSFPLWLDREYMIVTNRTEWRRQISSVLITKSNDPNPLNLSKILVPCERDEIECSGFLFSSKGRDLDVKNIPLAILDGPDALKSWERVKATNIIILLEQGEYDQNSENILNLLASAREDLLLPGIEGIYENPPAGIEVSMFAINLRGS